MERKRIREGRGHIAGSTAIFCKVRDIDISFDVSAEVCSARFLECDNCAFVDILAFLELDFRTIIDTGDSAEGEHEREILGPCVLRAGEAVVAVGCIVV